MGRYPELAGRCAIVTGSSTGIGEYVARALAAQQVHVAVVALTRLDAAEAIAADLRALGATRSFAAQADVTNPADVERLVRKAEERFGRVDILVNNAGGLGGVPRRPFMEMPLADWEQVVDLNLTSVFLCTRAVLPGMQSRRFGRIINTSSEVARNPVIPIAAHYTAGKTGVSAFTRYLAAEVAPFGINVLAFAPSTTLTAGLLTRYDAATLEGWKATIPLGRLATPEDQARTVLFLASDAAAFMSGRTLDVTGGKITV